MEQLPGFVPCDVSDIDQSDCRGEKEPPANRCAPSQAVIGPYPAAWSATGPLPHPRPLCPSAGVRPAPRRYSSEIRRCRGAADRQLPTRRGSSDHNGGPVTYARRDTVDAIRYLDHTSCVWRALPVDSLPSPTVKLADQIGFQVLHRQWVVERTLPGSPAAGGPYATTGVTAEHHAAMARRSIAIVMTRRPARYRPTGRLPAVTTSWPRHSTGKRESARSYDRAHQLTHRRGVFAGDIQKTERWPPDARRPSGTYGAYGAGQPSPMEWGNEPDPAQLGAESPLRTSEPAQYRPLMR